MVDTAKGVDYELELHDDIPDAARRSSTGKSVLETQLAKIMVNPAHHAPRWARIAKYANSAAAASAAAVLRKRHGDTQEVEGWRFETRRIENGQATGLFAQYDAEQIVPGRKEENAEKYSEYKARQKQALEQKAAEAARAEAEAHADKNPVKPRQAVTA